MALIREGRLSEANDAYDRLIVRFENAQEPALRKPAAIARSNKSELLGLLGQHQSRCTTRLSPDSPTRH